MNATQINEETIARTMSLLADILDHYKRTSRGPWERQLYPISEGCYIIREGKPDVNSPEVQILIQTGIAQFLRTSGNPDIPDSVLRILIEEQAKSELILNAYVDRMKNVRPLL